MNIVVLIARLIVGGVFVVAGGLKIGHADQFAAQIAAFGIVPQPVVAPMALLLPFLEVLLGLYLIVGLYTRLVAGIAIVQLLIFAGAIASAVLQGHSLSCGCFGPNDTSVTSWPEVGRDIALAVVAALIAWRPPGMLAVDRRIGNVT
jgi:uncharacterized membrane protein YphA (DoxX/SURF4 family)